MSLENSSLTEKVKVKTENPSHRESTEPATHTHSSREHQGSVLLHLCCLYLAPEERLSSGSTVLVVYELEQEKVEESYERGHAEPEEEGQAWVPVGHVFLVSEDGLEVQSVAEVLQMPQVCGDVEQRRDGLRHHDGEGVAFDL